MHLYDEMFANYFSFIPRLLPAWMLTHSFLILGFLLSNAIAPANGAEKNRFVSMDLFEPVFRHHSAVFDVVIAAPRELVPLECDAELLTCGLERANTLGYYLFADAVTRDDGDAMCICHERHHNETQKRSIATAA